MYFYHFRRIDTELRTDFLIIEQLGLTVAAYFNNSQLALNPTYIFVSSNSFRDYSTFRTTLMASPLFIVVYALSHSVILN